jgi:multiple sugar transport system substrate-binding protein
MPESPTTSPDIRRFLAVSAGAVLGASGLSACGAASVNRGSGIGGRSSNMTSTAARPNRVTPRTATWTTITDGVLRAEREPHACTCSA